MWWIIVNTISWCTGITIGLAAWHIIYYPLVVGENGTLTSGVVIDQLFAASLIGTIVACGQGLLLRKHMPSIWKWVVLSIIGLSVGALVVKYLNYPMIVSGGCRDAQCFFLLSEWMMDIGRPWALDGGMGWWGSSFALGGPVAGLILGASIALGQVIAVKQRPSIKALWVVSSAVGLGLAFRFNIITQTKPDILVVAAVVGLIYGVVTIIPLKYLLRDPNLNTVENVAPFRLAIEVVHKLTPIIHIVRNHIGATSYTNDRQQTVTTARKRWRFLNALLFLTGFLAPWTRACSSSNDTISGFGVTSFMGWFTFETLTRDIFQAIAHPAGWNYIALFTTPFIFVGLVCILLYALLYSLLNFRPDKRKHFYTRILLLLAGAVGMGSIILWLRDVNWQKTVDLKDLLWGYWLTWVALGSSLLFESINSLNQRVNLNTPSDEPSNNVFRNIDK